VPGWSAPFSFSAFLLEAESKAKGYNKAVAKRAEEFWQVRKFA